jgi:hypothetical protein
METQERQNFTSHKIIHAFIHTSQIYDQCPMVRLQSYSPFRPPHPIRLHGFPRTDSYPSHDPGLASQLPQGTISAPAEQQLLSRSICSCSKAVYKPIWHIPLLSVQWINSWWWTDELSETCRVSCQNKFVKLVLLVGFIIKKNVDGSLIGID